MRLRSGSHLALLLAALLLTLALRPLPLPPALPPALRPQAILCLSGDPGFVRVQRASARALQWPSVPLILSGAGFGGDAAAYLAGAAASLGVPPEQILLENDATSTFENFTRSRPLLDALGARVVLIISSRDHAHRAALAAAAALPGRELWFDVVSSSGEGPSFRARERAKIVRYVTRRWLPWSDLLSL
jgi:uncharacterized SAM-binding protein YcdF (DUF218 family)